MTGSAEWHTVPIGTVYAGLYDGPHATPAPSDIGPVFLGIGNVTEDGHLDLSSIRHIAEDDFGRWTKRVTPQPGDIVFTYEATLNRYAMIPDGFRGCLGRRMALIRPDETKALGRYLYYYFFSPEWRSVVARNTLSGATVDRIPLTHFPEFPVVLPPVSIQRRIAAMLSTYDDLIENNTRRIAILEEMARRLYEEWFIRFRFPGHEATRFTNTPKGRLPEGWQVVWVKDVVRRHKSGCVYKQSDVAATGSIIVIDQSRSEYLGFHDNDPDHPASPTAPVVIFGDHTCKMQVMVSPFSLGPNTVAFDGGDKVPLLYLFALVQGSVETREYKRHWTDLMNREVVLAAADLAERYDAKVRSMFSQIETLRRMSRALRAMRDLLLPKLVTGDIDLRAAEALPIAAE